MWLTTFLLVASGCHKENPAQSVEPSDTKPFDVAQAMMMVYGNYDVKAQTSVASLPNEKSSFPAAGEEQNTIRMLFNTSKATLVRDVSCLLPTQSPLVVKVLIATPAPRQLVWPPSLRTDKSGPSTP
jgi:hypothetical protein